MRIPYNFDEPMYIGFLFSLEILVKDINIMFLLKIYSQFMKLLVKRKMFISRLFKDIKEVSEITQSKYRQ